MNNPYIILLLIIIQVQACTTSHSDTKPNTFDSKSDTLIINTQKVKGHGLFLVGAGYMNFRDSSEWKEKLDWFDNDLIYPRNLKDIRIDLFSVFLKPIRFYAKSGSDTVQLNTLRKENTFHIIEGIVDGEKIFIVDQNSNKDLRDDSIRTFQEWNWRSDENLIKCHYTLDQKSGSKQDSGWIKIGKSRRNLLISPSEHHEAKFTIDEIHYTIGIVDENPGTFCYFRPAFALTGENGRARDTLYKNDILTKNEYIRLGNLYYKINDFFPGSGTMILVKEENFESLTGTQLGAKAPHFTLQTISGDTVRSTELKAPNLLIANMSGCTPRSYEEYGKMIKSLNGEITTIGMEYNVPKDLGGILVEIENEANQDFYKKYRNDYSSYDCYLIDKDYRISDKFSLFDWESHLTDYIEK